ncbi:hypothetical protein GGS23DRAFT_76710 [Durotheca rogersii]|uniref:uncharacterized protein n=1 Tax=Durotheca rogersii TaxID=419775 RepID=UPI00221F3FAC|nr:uncharacterized protein GGS23DRAFT_76710 [Durotheca rogersii]KAI5862951.1 hypothetical protein GGS23DRAFT_76710 [Durotheca rogersii]
MESNMSSEEPSLQPPQPPQPLSEFRPFPRLPVELRVMIWKETFHPRHVEMHPHRPRPDRSDATGWESRSENPIALYVCQESRAVTEERYPVKFTVFKPVARITGPPDESPARAHPQRLVRMDLNVDTLVILDEPPDGSLGDLYESAQAQDPLGWGLRFLGLGRRCWTGQLCREVIAAATGKGCLSRLDRLLLLMYRDDFPPDAFHAGDCDFERAEGTDSFQRNIADAADNLHRLEDYQKSVRLAPDQLQFMNLAFVNNPRFNCPVERCLSGNLDVSMY